ncbi:hypothetical protein [Leisingera sp. NJS204]|uniref:hypothetical protein n=1 Tax=Leisingera sp. NJS204 TaxID=2508307 RepID=UPI001010F641|nr:hypothetical protein [Leisingera sp. NJS204]QAX31081.1 hypothetical protein ETW24_17845 [Leisingera sp. NJS204]
MAPDGKTLDGIHFGSVKLCAKTPDLLHLAGHMQQKSRSIFICALTRLLRIAGAPLSRAPSGRAWKSGESHAPASVSAAQGKLHSRAAGQAGCESEDMKTPVLTVILRVCSARLTETGCRKKPALSAQYSENIQFLKDGAARGRKFELSLRHPPRMGNHSPDL